jgi:hypothetical protein
MAKLNDMTAPAKDAKTFDDWFFKQSKKAQDKMRENGVLPYREMVPSKHVFEINPNHPAWGTKDGVSASLRYQLDTERENQRTEVDSFISRDHVGVMLKAFIDAIAYSNSMEFRRHVELVRWALSLPGCLDSRTIGKMHGISHFTMRYRARKIMRLVNSDACGLFPHVNVRRDKHRKAPDKPCTPP